MADSAPFLSRDALSARDWFVSIHSGSSHLSIPMNDCWLSPAEDGVMQNKNMSQSDKTILVSGATGRQGGALMKHLLKRQWRVRALTRNPGGRVAQELSQRGVEFVQGDMDN